MTFFMENLTQFCSIVGELATVDEFGWKAYCFWNQEPKNSFLSWREKRAVSEEKKNAETAKQKLRNSARRVTLDGIEEFYDIEKLIFLAIFFLTAIKTDRVVI